MSGVDLAPLVRHAVLYGDELVVESARARFTAEANALRRRLLGPLVLTGLPQAEIDRLIDERAEARAAFLARLLEMKRALDALPAEIALARRQAGKKDTNPPKRGRATTAGLRASVIELHERGLMLPAIADTLNISDRRVREVLRDAGNLRNGHRKRPVQAAVSADTRVGQPA